MLEEINRGTDSPANPIRRSDPPNSTTIVLEVISKEAYVLEEICSDVQRKWHPVDYEYVKEWLS